MSQPGAWLLPSWASGSPVFGSWPLSNASKSAFETWAFKREAFSPAPIPFAIGFMIAGIVFILRHMFEISDGSADGFTC